VTVVTGSLKQGHAAKALYDAIFIAAVSKSAALAARQLAEVVDSSLSREQGNSGVARLFFKTKGIVTGRRAFNAAIKPLPDLNVLPL